VGCLDLLGNTSVTFAKKAHRLNGGNKRVTVAGQRTAQKLCPSYTYEHINSSAEPTFITIKFNLNRKEIFYAN
jgi:hypothetical protein